MGTATEYVRKLQGSRFHFAGSIFDELPGGEHDSLLGVVRFIVSGKLIIRQWNTGMVEVARPDESDIVFSSDSIVGENLRRSVMNLCLIHEEQASDERVARLYWNKYCNEVDGF